MNSVYRTELELPPGLWLPTPEESTDQYLAENFAHKKHDYEDVLDYGAFVVALACFDESRVCKMPRFYDIDDLRAVGYGMAERTLHDGYGGIRRIQLDLGFYPRGYEPEPDELFKRMHWIVEYAFPESEGRRPQHLREVMEWGSARRLCPTERIILKVLDGNTGDLRRYIDLEKKRSHGENPKMDLLKFGARVIAENDGPIGQYELDEKYDDEFANSPYGAIRHIFGSLKNLWKEFDYYPETHGYEAEDYVLLGLRWAIKNDSPWITTRAINEMTKAKLFPSKVPIAKHFGGIPAFRDRIIEKFEIYDVFRTELEKRGINREVIMIACRDFDASEDFMVGVLEKFEPLAKLSADNYQAKYIQKLLVNGFDLLDEEVMEYQQRDLNSYLRKLGISEKQDLDYIYSLIPRYY